MFEPAGRIRPVLVRINPQEGVLEIRDAGRGVERGQSRPLGPRAASTSVKWHALTPSVSYKTAPPEIPPPSNAGHARRHSRLAGSSTGPRRSSRLVEAAAVDM